MNRSKNNCVIGWIGYLVIQKVRLKVRLVVHVITIGFHDGFLSYQQDSTFIDFSRLPRHLAIYEEIDRLSEKKLR